MQSLLIFVKNPIAGQTKTRLAASVGHDKALLMYQQLMDYTRQQTAALDETRRLLLYSNFVPNSDTWPSPPFEKYVQEGADLGSRMKNAFRFAFEQGAKRVIIIGSDCPGVTTTLLKEAFATLEVQDVVLGPALDGGYYLLGMRSFYPSLFDDIAWSTETVAAQTLAATEQLGLSVAQLPALSDVDYLEDWLHYGWAIPD